MKAPKVKLEHLVLRAKLAPLVQWVLWAHWDREECQERGEDLGHRVLLDNEVLMACLENLDQWVPLGYLALLVFQEILE